MIYQQNALIIHRVTLSEELARDIHAVILEVLHLSHRYI